MKKDVLTFHQRYFPTSAESKVYFAPGRVNLIGEHIDYLGGNVLPFAIEQGNLSAISLRQDETIQLISDSFEESGIIQTTLSNTTFDPSKSWANYVIGCVDLAKKKGYAIPQGFEMSIVSDLPAGAGLSSSASIEVLTFFALSETFDWDLSRKEIALLAKEVENDYIGVQCGIMDQFVISHGQKDKAVWLNTTTLEFEIVDAYIKGTTYVIADTGKKRGLVSSKYNERREETTHCLQAIQRRAPYHHLCDLSSDDLENMKQFIPSEIEYKRARHATTENERVKESILAILYQDPVALGRCLSESHRSLRDDFEVSCAELDTMVEISKSLGSYGARMTGAGFGGCTIHLVKSNEVENFMRQLKERYEASTGLQATVFPSVPAEGVREIV